MKFFLRLISLFLFLSSVSQASGLVDSKITQILNNDTYDSDYRNALKQVYLSGPNFNQRDYVFTLGCGGGAICGYIFDAESLKIIDFPEPYVIDDFQVTYHKTSDRICFSGKSALDSKNHQNNCYHLESGKLLPVLNFLSH